MGHKRRLSFFLSPIVLTVLLCGGCGKTGANAEKILGTWELVKVNGAEPPMRPTMEFQRDGVLYYSMMGVKVKGSYKLEGSQLTTTLTGADGKTRTTTAEIAELTDQTLVASSGKDRSEYRRKDAPGKPG
jgi:uncharacterized protein (TIGR03066 family)